MKRIARTLVIVTLSSAATAAVAVDTSFPPGVENQVPLSEEFSNIDTYKKEHRDSVNQTPLTYPAAGLQEYPLSGEFPNLQSYQDIHRNDPVVQSTTPTFPYSVPEEQSLADEGLVPGIANVPPYNNRGAVGKTR
ncbi:MAG: hypothetical protein JWN13_1899 [Betaproteobacteria bacterium]|jgi:hypothetical protein|nr:hypothetical protein [Betaproteobacteria bacterium]